MFHYNKKIRPIIIVALILIITMIGSKLNIIENISSVFEEDGFPKARDMNAYTIKVDFDPVEKILTANEQITYINGGNKGFNALYLHLYPNAFKTEASAPFEKGEMTRAYPHGFEPGYMQIHRVESKGEPLNYVVMGKGDTILKINLNKELEPGHRIDLDLDFSVKIPPSYGRFGYGENTVNIANWYPIVSVFDENGWNLEPYYAIGDPFYSDMANYRVVVSIPGEYILASTGECIKKESIDGKINWTIEAKSVRDFAMILSDKFKMVEDETDEIKINAYYFEDKFGDVSLQTAKDAIRIFSEIFGKYPYKQFSVAASDFFIGGMEYPNLVFIDQELYQDQNKEFLEYVIAHEAAHQWWYGIVGNDEVDEPWLDEALTEYSTLLYYEKKYGPEMKNQIFKNMIVRYYNAYRDSQLNFDESVYRSIDKFKDSHEYQILVYYKGAMFLQDLRTQLGDEQFFKVMKVYFDKYKYKNANTENFIKVCEQVSNQSLRENFKEWLKYEKE